MLQPPIVMEKCPREGDGTLDDIRTFRDRLGSKNTHSALIFLGGMHNMISPQGNSVHLLFLFRSLSNIRTSRFYPFPKKTIL